MNLGKLHQAIAAVCPIDGVSSDGTIWFALEATPEQQAAAHATYTNFQDPPEEDDPAAIAAKIQQLEAALRETALWAHIWVAMTSNVRANGCASFLLIALTNTRNPNDLVFGWNQLRLALRHEAGVDDFSQEHIDFLGSTLESIGLNLPGLDLTAPV